MSEEIAKGQATYWGGYFLHPASGRGDSGKFTLTKDKIIFDKIAFFSGNRWRIEIPINKIFWKKISQQPGEDMGYKNAAAGWAYLAGRPAVTSYSKNITFLTIPFKDEKGIEQSPKFSFGNQKVLEQISKFIYNKM